MRTLEDGLMDETLSPNARLCLAFAAMRGGSITVDEAQGDLDEWVAANGKATHEKVLRWLRDNAYEILFAIAVVQEKSKPGGSLRRFQGESLNEPT